MKTSLRLVLVAALPAVLSVGCKDWLTGDKLSDNPNKPTTATAEQIFTGLEVSIMALWESGAGGGGQMNLLPLWAQQIVGVTRQWADFANYLSGTDNLTADLLWSQVYGGRTHAQGALLHAHLARCRFYREVRRSVDRSATGNLDGYRRPADQLAQLRPAGYPHHDRRRAESLLPVPDRT